MTFQITTESFHKLFPYAKNPATFADALNTYLPEYEINTDARIKMFLAQCGQECEGFTCFIENLNYSAEALLKTWPTRFDKELAESSARNPEAIANIAYGGRLGNITAGDGWKFRGAGAIQLTGRNIQVAFAKAVGMNVDGLHIYLLTEEGAVRSACWFWKNNGCNHFADNNDFEGLTKRINGAYNGLKERKELLAKVEGVLYETT